MAYGVKALRKIQIGKESTAGVATAATTYLRGEGVISDDRTQVFPVEDVGILGGTDRSYVAGLAANMALQSGPATFEQLPYILNMGVVGSSSTQDGAGTDYIYSYPFGTTAQKTPYFYTVEAGNNAEEERMEYCHVPDFVLEGKKDEAIMRSATIRGRQATVSSFTGALSIPTVEEMLFNKGKVYIDAVGGTIGTTQAVASLIGWKATINTGFKAVPSFDGSLYFTFVKQTRPEITMEFTWEHETVVSVAEKVLWRAQTARQIRLLVAGSTLGSTGTLYSTKNFIFDMAGKWSKFGPLTEDAGDDTVVGTFHVGYNSTAALYASMKVVNELSALP